MHSRFTPTCFSKSLPSSVGRSYLRSYSNNICVVDVYGLQSVQCGQLSRDVTNSVQRVQFLRWRTLLVTSIDNWPHWTDRNPYTRCLQKNGAVLKINKKFISHLTRTKRTPSAVATVQVFYALIIVLQCVHPGSHNKHPHDNRIRPIQYVYVVVSICSTSDPALLENTIE
jgi:hypothetical protein